MTILTLDAGGTNFVFAAIKNGKLLGGSINKPAMGHDLGSCLNNIISGFRELENICDEKPDAISFAFPGPADFKNGIIGDLHNLTGFRGGVALGPMLEEIFNIPVFINNDGDLFAYGEALSGTLPMINEELRKNKSHKQYKNLTGMTIGTGFGAGIVHDGILVSGDNICAGEIWATSNRQSHDYNSEEGVSIRAVRHFFSEFSGIESENCPQPKDIYDIGKQKEHPQNQAAIAAYQQLGRYIGDSIANMITLTDGIIVIGGGVAGAKDLIIPGIETELKREFKKLDGSNNPRTTQKVFCLNDKEQFEEFVKDYGKTIKVPFSNKEIYYDSRPRCAYMFSDFDTSLMISLGAYYIAVRSIG